MPLSPNINPTACCTIPLSACIRAFVTPSALSEDVPLLSPSSGLCSKRGGETETDTEAAAILTKYVFNNTPSRESLTFTNLIGAVLKELEGSFTFVFEIIHAEIGSPLLVGVKTDRKLFVDVEFARQAVESSQQKSQVSR
jgi:hypothetical protein